MALAWYFLGSALAGLAKIRTITMATQKSFKDFSSVPTMDPKTILIISPYTNGKGTWQVAIPAPAETAPVDLGKVFKALLKAAGPDFGPFGSSTLNRNKGLDNSDSYGPGKTATAEGILSTLERLEIPDYIFPTIKMAKEGITALTGRTDIIHGTPAGLVGSGYRPHPTNI